MTSLNSTISEGLENLPKGKVSNFSTFTADQDSENSHTLKIIEGLQLLGDWEEFDRFAKAEHSKIPKSPRPYSINGSRCFDGNMEVLHLFDSLRFIPNHITFSFRYRQQRFYKNGFDGWCFRQQLMRDYIFAVRKDLDLPQRDLNVFGTGEEAEPKVVHTHHNLSVRNATPEKLQRILESMRRLLPQEVQCPAYIELTNDSHKSMSYTVKIRQGMPEKEIHCTAGYWKFVMKTKRELENLRNGDPAG